MCTWPTSSSVTLGFTIKKRCGIIPSWTHAYRLVAATTTTLEVLLDATFEFPIPSIKVKSWATNRVSCCRLPRAPNDNMVWKKWPNSIDHIKDRHTSSTPFSIFREWGHGALSLNGGVPFSEDSRISFFSSKGMKNGHEEWRMENGHSRGCVTTLLSNFISQESMKNIACVDQKLNSPYDLLNHCLNPKGPRIHGFKMTNSIDQSLLNP